MYEHSPNKCVKISVGHLYPSISRATVYKRGTKMPQVITSLWHGLRKFVTVLNSTEGSTFPSCNFFVELLYA